MELVRAEAAAAAAARDAALADRAAAEATLAAWHERAAAAEAQHGALEAAQRELLQLQLSGAGEAQRWEGQLLLQQRQLDEARRAAEQQQHAAAAAAAQQQVLQGEVAQLRQLLSLKDQQIGALSRPSSADSWAQLSPEAAQRLQAQAEELLGRVEGLKAALAARDSAAAEAEQQRRRLQAALEAAQDQANGAECRATDSAALAKEWQQQAAALREQLAEAKQRGGWAAGAGKAVQLGEGEKSSSELIAAVRPGEVTSAEPAAAALEPVVVRLVVSDGPAAPELEAEAAALRQRCGQLESQAAVLQRRAHELEEQHQQVLLELQLEHATALEQQQEQHEEEVHVLLRQHADSEAAYVAAAAASAAFDSPRPLARTGSVPASADGRTPSPLQLRFQQRLRQVQEQHVEEVAALQQRHEAALVDERRRAADAAAAATQQHREALEALAADHEQQVGAGWRSAGPLLQMCLQCLLHWPLPLPSAAAHGAAAAGGRGGGS